MNRRVSRACCLLLALAMVASSSRGQSVPSTTYDLGEDVARLIAPLEEVLDEAVERAMVVDGIPGAAVALVVRGRLVLAKGYGLADQDAGTPVVPDRTLFRIGSTSKALTGLAAMALVDRGQLSLDAPLDSPRIPSTLHSGADTSPVTLTHLLTHTGGFDQLGSRRNFDDPGNRPSLGDWLARDLIRIRPPGLMACYDTYGISLAGQLVADALDTTYGDAMRQLVFEPLGMTHTYVEAPDSARADLAVGYAWDGARHTPQRYEWYASLPASSIDSTVLDMGRLLEALMGDGSNRHGRLFSKETAEAVRAGGQHRPHPDFAGFTHGLWDRQRHGVRVLEHGGTMRGYSGLMVLAPERGVAFYVACTRDVETGLPVSLQERVANALFGGREDARTAEDVPPMPIEAAELESFAGRYGNNLFCHTCPPGGGWPPPSPLEPVEVAGPDALAFRGIEWTSVAPDVFATPDRRQRIGFGRDAQGRVTHLSLSWDPGLTLERFDEQLLQSVFGADGGEGTALRAAVTRR